MNDEASKGPPPYLSSWVCTALMRLGTRMATGFDQHFAPIGVTQAQFRILLAVWEESGAEGIAPSVLADRLLIERATVSVITSRMIERGWLARRPGENRRTFRLFLAPEGERLLDRLLPSAVALAEATLEGIDPAVLAQVRQTLEIVEARLRQDFAGKKENNG